MTFLERLIRKELERYPEELREQVYRDLFEREVSEKEDPQETTELFVVEHIPEITQCIHDRVEYWFEGKSFRDALEAPRQQFLALSIPEQLWEVLQAIKGNKNQ